MSCIPVVEKAVAEQFPIGLIYSAPDLETPEIITVSTVAVSPVGLTLGAVTINAAGDTVSAYVSAGTAGVEYVVLFKVTTSGGKIFNNPNKDAITVRVI
jgi:hypothetical protein